jgi:hypothetical protein
MQEARVVGVDLREAVAAAQGDGPPPSSRAVLRLEFVHRPECVEHATRKCNDAAYTQHAPHGT